MGSRFGPLTRVRLCTFINRRIAATRLDSKSRVYVSQLYYNIKIDVSIFQQKKKNHYINIIIRPKDLHLYIFGSPLNLPR